MADSTESILQEEIAVLQSIYMDEIVINGPEEWPKEIMIMLHPYTADEDDKKYVFMQLFIRLSKKYPQVKPSFVIKHPRGISDAQLESILVNLNALASQKIGQAALFDLIEYAKECLTDNNKPECDCAICMDNFKLEEEFVRTDCYHYFHLLCMARYVESMSSENQTSEQEEQADTTSVVIPCPICRSLIKQELIKISSINTEEPEPDKVDFKPSKKFLRWREKMKEVYAKQQKRGGIIDIEAERNKFLIQAKAKPETNEIGSSLFLGQHKETRENKARPVTSGKPNEAAGYPKVNFDKNTEKLSERKADLASKEISNSLKYQGYYRTQRKSSNYDRQRSDTRPPIKTKKENIDNFSRRKRVVNAKTSSKEDNRTSSNEKEVQKSRSSRKDFRQEYELTDSKQMTEKIDKDLSFEVTRNLRPPPGFKPI